MAATCIQSVPGRSIWEERKLMLAQRICLRNTQNSNSSFSMPTAVFQNGTLLHVE